MTDTWEWCNLFLQSRQANNLSPRAIDYYDGYLHRFFTTIIKDELITSGIATLIP